MNVSIVAREERSGGMVSVPYYIGEGQERGKDAPLSSWDPFGGESIVASWGRAEDGDPKSMWRLLDQRINPVGISQVERPLGRTEGSGRVERTASTSDVQGRVC